MKIKLYLVLIAISLTLTSCSDASNARDVLSKQGYKNINITGYDMFSCSEDDFYSTGFTAKNSNGVVIEGTVCSGFFFKGSTIRF